MTKFHSPLQVHMKIFTSSSVVIFSEANRSETLDRGLSYKTKLDQIEEALSGSQVIRITQCMGTVTNRVPAWVL